MTKGAKGKGSGGQPPAGRGGGYGLSPLSPTAKPFTMGAMQRRVVKMTTHQPRGPPPPSVIQQMGERELKNELRNHGLETSGSKAQLAARLASLSSPG